MNLAANPPTENYSLLRRAMRWVVGAEEQEAHRALIKSARDTRMPVRNIAGMQPVAAFFRDWPRAGVTLQTGAGIRSTRIADPNDWTAQWRIEYFTIGDNSQRVGGVQSALHMIDHPGEIIVEEGYLVNVATGQVYQKGKPATVHAFIDIHWVCPEPTIFKFTCAIPPKNELAEAFAKTAQKVIQ